MTLALVLVHYPLTKAATLVHVQAKNTTDHNCGHLKISVCFTKPIVLILVKVGFLAEGCWMSCASVLTWQDERHKMLTDFLSGYGHMGGETTLHFMDLRRNQRKGEQQRGRDVLFYIFCRRSGRFAGNYCILTYKNQAFLHFCNGF